MTHPSRFGRALQGAAKGIVPGAIGAIVLLLLVLAKYCALVLHPAALVVLIVMVIIGGFFGAAIGLTIGVVSPREQVDTGFLQVCAWMVCGCLACNVVTGLPWLLVVGITGRPGEPHVNWSNAAFSSCFGAIVGPVIGSLISGQPKSRKIVRLLVMATGVPACIYLVLGAVATGMRTDTEAIGPVHCVAVSPDRKRIISGHQDSTVRVWDSETGVLLHRFRFKTNRAAVVGVAVSPNGRDVAFAFGSLEIQIWDIETNQSVRRLTGHLENVTSVAYSSDGRLVVSGSDDRSVRVWDAETGTQLQCCNGHKAGVNSISMSSDGKFIMSGGGDYSGGRLNDPSVRLWDPKTGSELPRLEGEADTTRCVAISPNSQHVASAGWDKGVLVWNMKTGKRIHHFPSRTNCVAFTTDGKRIISDEADGSVVIWDVEQGKEIARLPDHAGEISGLAVMPDGVHVITCSGSWQRPLDRIIFGHFVQQRAIPLGCSIRIWNLQTCQEVRQLDLAAKTANE